MPNLPREERPRFQDRTEADFNRSDVNPFLTEHRSYGHPLLPASKAWPFRGRWHEAFGRKAPLHVEIGSGNGFFLAELARRNPDWNVLGVEIRYKRTVLCAKKIQAAEVSNALIARYDAWFLDDVFAPGEIDGLYINHPDPWPKSRHEKNRLISRWFLEDACQIVREGGWIRAKSDFEDNIARIPRLLEADGDGKPAPKLPLVISGRSEDVITGPAPWPNDIETNYQSKFRKRGLPVFGIELTRTPDEVAAP
ncbi:MAG: tRNA (guanosine(46)-N7)-methyltransferase TrmB [Myxococcota bacterium]